MFPEIFNLLAVFLQIGLFSIGGGYATIPLIEKQVVTIHGWLSLQEFIDIITISQMTPGPLAVNTSTFAGLRIAGVAGAAAATFGCVISGSLISIFLHRFFEKWKSNCHINYVRSGLQAISVGLIAASAATMIALAFWGNSDIREIHALPDITSVCIFLFCFAVLKKWKLGTVPIILLSGAAGILCQVLRF